MRLGARGQERVDATVAESSRLVPRVSIRGVAADLASADGAGRLIEAAPSADILINIMGTAFLRPYEGLADALKISDDEWLELLQINVMIRERTSRHYLPGMVERGWGRIVFVSSESAVDIPKEMIDYGMTKTAQLAVSRGLAEAAAGTGVAVNAVLPGPTRTEIMSKAMAGMADAQGVTQAEAEQASPRSAPPTSLLGRFATPEEVANLVVYVSSEQASATNGASLRVDGGVVRFAA